MRSLLAFALFAFVVALAPPAAAADGSRHARAGVDAEEAGNREEALRQYTRAIESGDLHDAALAYVHFRRGAIRAYLGMNAAAVEDFTGSIERDPHVGEAHSMRGYLHGVAGDYEAAERDHAAALGLAPSRTGGVYLSWMLQHYADLRRRQRRFDEALAIVNRALAAQDHADAHFRRAWIYLDMHRPEEARADYRRFLAAASRDGRSGDAYWPDEREAIGRLKVLSDLK